MHAKEATDVRHFVERKKYKHVNEHSLEKIFLII